MTLLRLENVWKRYGRVEAVKNVSLKCEEGEFLAFVGPSGCGKTSTLRMIAGLEIITSGSIYIKDRLVNNLKPGERNIAMAFENYALYPTLSVYENIAFPLRAQKMASNKIKENIFAIADLLRIEDILTSKPKELSGGQQQRISLARALVKNADLYLMDEPISHLDADMRRRMRAELKRLHQTTGMTVVYVTHDQLEAMSMADRIAVMNDGIIRQLGTPSEIFDHPQDEFVAGFIGSPPMNFFDCLLRTQAGRFAIEVGTCSFFISDEIGNKLQKSINLQNGRLRLGIRPEDIDLAPAPADGAMSGKILIIEPVGESIIYRIAISDKFDLLAEVPADSAVSVEEGRIHVSFTPEKMHFFHPETGNALYT